jgi:hypothetical protein
MKSPAILHPPGTFGIVLAGIVSTGLFCASALAQDKATPAPTPTPHPAVGQRLVPPDVDWEHPVYETRFADAATLKDWRMEGGDRMEIVDGKLVLTSRPGTGATANHLVCWLTREMPANFLLEFGVRPENRQEGLNIVFFNARGIHGEDIFSPSLQPRDGLFKQYTNGDVNSYHISYWAGARGTANVRKNSGFHLVAVGRDLVVDGPADAFITVRVYKHGGTIRLMVNDVIAAAYDDDGKTFGPVWNHTGWIGLRQMAQTVRCEYDHLKIWPLK